MIRKRSSDDADLDMKFNSLVDLINKRAISTGETAECHIEVKEVRKIKGNCMKLLGGTHACKAGDYMEPFSADCV